MAGGGGCRSLLRSCLRRLAFEEWRSILGPGSENMGHAVLHPGAQRLLHEDSSKSQSQILQAISGLGKSGHSS